jgi:hypothetical protein
MNDRGTVISVGIVYSGKIKNGAIVIDDGDADLPEGAQVTVVVAAKGEPTLELSPEERAELEAAEAEADRGEGVSWQSLRAQLFPRR